MSAGVTEGFGGVEQFGEDGELRQLLDAAVERLLPARRTFTEEEALQNIWDAGYEVVPQIDPRFVLAHEAQGKHPRYWLLSVHRLANERLLNALTENTWDGRNLDAELTRLSVEDDVHYVFYPFDQRFTLRSNSVYERADRDEFVELPSSTSEELDSLCSPLLDRWNTEGGEAWSTRQVTEMLGQIGWTQVEARESWLLVQAWLRSCPQVTRVGQDYWIPAEQLPSQPQQIHLRVLPSVPARRSKDQNVEPVDKPSGSVGTQISSRDSEVTKSQVLFGQPKDVNAATWTLPLRTAHLVGGFVPVPSSARGAYPARATGEGTMTALRALWFESGERLWIWLDRQEDKLFGPQLADQLGWREAGDLLRVEWTPDVIVLQITGHDDEVQLEETRLVDTDTLAALRGGLGESYRASLQAILKETPEGLTFPDLVAAIRERQGHAVHHGTIRAILHAGGFVQHEGKWLAAPEEVAAVRNLRAAIVDGLVTPDAQEGQSTNSTPNQSLRTRAQNIRSRLSILVDRLSGH